MFMLQFAARSRIGASRCAYFESSMSWRAVLLLLLLLLAALASLGEEAVSVGGYYPFVIPANRFERDVERGPQPRWRTHSHGMGLFLFPPSQHDQFSVSIHTEC